MRSKAINLLLLLPALLLVLTSCSSKDKYEIQGLSFTSPFDAPFQTGKPSIPVEGWPNIQQASTLTYGVPQDGITIAIIAVEYKAPSPISNLEGAYEFAMENIGTKYGSFGYSSDTINMVGGGVHCKSIRGNFGPKDDPVRLRVLVLQDGLTTWTFEICYNDQRKDYAEQVDNLIKSIYVKKKQ